MEGIGIEKARHTLGEIVNRAQYKDELTVITRAGKPAAVVISIDMAMELRAASLTTPAGMLYGRLLRELREAQEAVSPGRSGVAQVSQGEEDGALCQVTALRLDFHGKYP